MAAVAVALPGAARAAGQAPGAPQATPVGNPASWFPADAYPPQAKAAGMEGRTAFSLNIDDKGRITGCNITSSSGSTLLDSRTCELLVTNARFKPATNAQGQAVAGTWNSAMVWKLSAPAALQDPDAYQDDSGPSQAEIYNQTLTDAKRAALEAKDGSDDGGAQGGGGGDDNQ